MARVGHSKAEIENQRHWPGSRGSKDGSAVSLDCLSNVLLLLSFTLLFAARCLLALFPTKAVHICKPLHLQVKIQARLGLH